MPVSTVLSMCTCFRYSYILHATYVSVLINWHMQGLKYIFPQGTLMPLTCVPRTSLTRSWTLWRTPSGSTSSTTLTSGTRTLTFFWEKKTRRKWRKSGMGSKNVNFFTRFQILLRKKFYEILIQKNVYLILYLLNPSQTWFKIASLKSKELFCYKSGHSIQFILKISKFTF